MIYFLYHMEFEWDPIKSAENKRKHGIGFDEAAYIWQSIRLEVQNLAYSKQEEWRSATIGFVNGRVYTVIWTKRNKRIRIICARRARKNEKKAFLENF